jgi:hypothetical protein
MGWTSFNEHEKSHKFSRRLQAVCYMELSNLEIKIFTLDFLTVYRYTAIQLQSDLLRGLWLRGSCSNSTVGRNVV